MLFPPGWLVSSCRPDRGDYRLRRAWPGWRIDRRWFGGWTQVAWFLTWSQAHNVLHELADWQMVASEDARATMRGDMPDDSALRAFFDPALSQRRVKG